MTLPPAFIFYPGQNVWLCAVIGFSAGLYVFYRGFSLFQRRRLILDVPASKIRSASIGLMELSGSAVGPNAMQSPLAGAPCFYYRSMAWQLKRSGNNSRWEKVADESLHLPFYLEDSSGRVLVDPQGAEVDIHREFHNEFDTPLTSSQLELPANVASFLVRHGLDTAQKLKLEEYCIKPKSALFVLGTLAPNPGVNVSATPVQSIPDDPIKFGFNMKLPDTLTGDAPVAPPAPRADFHLTPEVIRLPGTRPPSSSARMTQQEKVAAALAKAGIANPAAWSAPEMELPEVAAHSAVEPAKAGTIATTTGAGAAAVTAPESDFDLTPKTVLMKGDNNPSFFISWCSQREVVQSLGWKSTLMIWGGPALSLLSLFFLLQHLGWL